MYLCYNLFHFWELIMGENKILVNRGLAQMLKGGVIMDVVNADQAKIAEDAGACAVMALERIPADIRLAGGVARMSSVELIQSIKTSQFQLWLNVELVIFQKHKYCRL